MSDPSQAPPPATEPNQPTASLNYISPRDDAELAEREAERARVGTVLTAMATLILVFFWLVNTHDFGPPTTGPSTRGSHLGLWITTALAMAIFGGTALIHYSRDRSTAFAKGILIGLGIAALIEGLCFMLMTR